MQTNVASLFTETDVTQDIEIAEAFVTEVEQVLAIRQ